MTSGGLQRLILEGMGTVEAMEKLPLRLTQTKSGFQKNRAASEEGTLQTQTDCSECAGTGVQVVPNGRGGHHARICSCADRARQLDRLGSRDREVRIDSLAVCYDPTKCFSPPDLQRQIIETLRANPDDSFAFFGPSGYAKTTYLAALWHRAVTESKGHGCFYQQTRDLVRELRSYEFDKEDAPYVCRQVVRETVAKHLRPRVFLDEFDKVSPTDFARNSIHELVDELYQLAVGTTTGVQLVLATNLDRDEFMAVWGANILRRIEAVCEAVFDFFSEITTARK
jgi:DNA replication protein DnaC